LVRSISDHPYLFSRVFPRQNDHEMRCMPQVITMRGLGIQRSNIAEFLLCRENIRGRITAPCIPNLCFPLPLKGIAAFVVVCKWLNFFRHSKWPWIGLKKTPPLCRYSKEVSQSVLFKPKQYREIDWITILRPFGDSLNLLTKRLRRGRLELPIIQGLYEVPAVLTSVRGAFDSAKNHKRQRHKRQSVTAKREKSQTPEFV